VNDDERAFLAQVALGWFTVREDGTIWRHVEFHGGGNDAPSVEYLATPRRAERNSSAEDGYLRVLFWDFGVRRKAVAHRIVWMVTTRRWIPAAMEINHVDGVKYNNNPANLELVTRSENVRHAIRVLGRRRKAQPGESNAQAKLTEAQVMEIRTLGESKAMTQKEIAARFGIEQTNVSAILRRKSWAHLV
jgi:hypothetical protein